MDTHVAAAMREELAKLAGVASRAASLVTGSKAKALGAAAVERTDEASMLRNIANAGGRWRHGSSARDTARLHNSAERVGRAASKIDGLHKKERKAVQLTRAGLGAGAAAGLGAGYAKSEKSTP